MYFCLQPIILVLTHFFLVFKGNVLKRGIKQHVKGLEIRLEAKNTSCS